jgi:protein involved in polysaccharide export with SLBB domain
MRSTKVKEIDEKRFTVSKDGFLDVPMVGKLQAAGLQVI